MKNLVKQQGFLFTLALILVIGIVFPQDAIATSMKTSWKKEFKGEPLFEPRAQKEGSLMYGNYNIINNVYHADIMTLDSKGKQKKTWKLKEQRIEMGGTESSPLLISLNHTKGTFKAYSLSGKLRWTYSVKKKMDKYEDGYQIDSLGNIYIFVGKDLYKVSPKGKLLYKMKKPVDNETTYHQIELGSDGSLFIQKFMTDDLAKTSLTKYNNSGKKLWTQSIFSQDPDVSQLNRSYVGKTGNLTYVIATFAFDDGQNYQEYRKLYAIDKNGQVSWVKQSDVHFYQIHEYKGNTIVLTDSEYYQVDSKGTISKQISNISNMDSYTDSDLINSAELDAKGNLYILTDKAIQKITYSGKVEWKKKLKAYTYYNMKMTNDLLLLQKRKANEYTVYTTTGKVQSEIKLPSTSYYYSVSGATNKKTFYFIGRQWVEKTNSVKSTLYSMKK